MFKNRKLKTVTTAILKISGNMPYSGHTLNQSPKKVSPNINNAIKHIHNINLNIENGNFVFSPFFTFTIVTNKHIAESPVAIIHSVE